MVTLDLIIEGGTYTDNASADTYFNIESLRQSLHNFFSRILNRDDIGIVIHMGAGYRNALKAFINSTNSYGLFVDSDLPPENKNSWFDKLINIEHPENSINVPDERKAYIFFMIQEMEAWFLKQPECISRWAEIEGYCRKDSSIDIKYHSTIKGKNIESIAKPSEKLSIIMKHFFYKGAKAAKYGKLKTAPLLLDSLDVTILIPLDLELQRFISMVNDISVSNYR